MYVYICVCMCVCISAYECMYMYVIIYTHAGTYASMQNYTKKLVEKIA